MQSTASLLHLNWIFINVVTGIKTKLTVIMLDFESTPNTIITFQGVNALSSQNDEWP